MEQSKVNDLLLLATQYFINRMRHHGVPEEIIEDEGTTLLMSLMECAINDEPVGNILFKVGIVMAEPFVQNVQNTMQDIMENPLPDHP